MGFSAGMPDEDSRMWALLAHCSGIPLSVLGPLIIYFVKKDESPFVAYHSVQAFYWSAVTFVVVTVGSILTCGAGSLVLFFFWVAALYIGLRAKEGEWYGYWFIDHFGKEGKLF